MNPEIHLESKNLEMAWHGMIMTRHDTDYFGAALFWQGLAWHVKPWHGPARGKPGNMGYGCVSM